MSPASYHCFRLSLMSKIFTFANIRSSIMLNRFTPEFQWPRHFSTVIHRNRSFFSKTLKATLLYMSTTRQMTRMSSNRTSFDFVSKRHDQHSETNIISDIYIVNYLRDLISRLYNHAFNIIIIFNISLVINIYHLRSNSRENQSYSISSFKIENLKSLQNSIYFL